MPPTDTAADAAPRTPDTATPAQTGRRAVPAPPASRSEVTAPATELAAALARVADLEAELGTVTADRDAAIEQLRAAQSAPAETPTPRVVVGLLERLVRATEATALVALAATRSGRDASDLRTRAGELLELGKVAR